MITLSHACILSMPYLGCKLYVKSGAIKSLFKNKNVRLINYMEPIIKSPINGL